MHSSSVVVLALIAAAAAAPIKVDVEARAGLSSLGGASKVLGNVASGAGLLSSGINIGKFVDSLFGGDAAAAKRALAELEGQLVARGMSQHEARAGLGGFSKVLGNVASGAGLLSSGINIGNFVDSLFGGDAAAREITELEARAGLSSLGGASKVLGNVASGAGLLSSGINIGKFVDSLFGGDDAAARRAIETELVARGMTEHEARAGLAGLGGLTKVLGNVASGAGILSSGINIGNFVSSLFGGDDAAAKRALADMETELVARGMTEHEARAGLSSLGGLTKVLGNVASGAGILSSGINIGNFVSSLFGGDDAAAKRALADMETELVARGMSEHEARAGLSSLGGLTKVLGNVASGAGLLSSGINIGNFVSGLFGGDDAAAKRALADMETELVARGMSEHEARAGLGGLTKVLGNVANGAGILSSGINIGKFVDSLFGGDAAARRELDSRAGLASLGKIGSNLLNLGSLGFSLGNIGDALFGRELDEHLAREFVEQELYRRMVSDLD